MSLKAFHVIFISISVLLCLGFGAWCFGSDYARGQSAYVAVGCGSFLLAAGLVVYEIIFLQKVKGNQ